MLNKTEKMNTSDKGGLLLQLGEADFEAEVLRAKQPVLVGFWAPWSRPCQVFDSVLQDLARACAGKIKVFKVNADDSLNLSLWYEIRSIPTLLYFVEGESRLRIVGTATKQAILNKLEPFGVRSEPPDSAGEASGSGCAPGKEEPKAGL